MIEKNKKNKKHETRDCLLAWGLRPTGKATRLRGNCEAETIPRTHTNTHTPIWTRAPTPPGCGAGKGVVVHLHCSHPRPREIWDTTVRICFFCDNQTNERMLRTYERMSEWTNERMNEWTNERTEINGNQRKPTKIKENQWKSNKTTKINKKAVVVHLHCSAHFWACDVGGKRR